jgi:hypothetical protein
MLGSDSTREALFRALAGRQESYRQRMRPADIIQQSLIERGDRKPIGLAELLKKLVRIKSKA